MLLKLTHETNLSYTDLISESVMELRVAPRQEQDQHRLAFTLAVGPATPAFSYFDWQGNTVHWFTVNPFHRQIRIVATSIVETDRPRPEPQRFKDTWPLSPDAYDYTVYDYLQFGGPVARDPALVALVEEISPQPGDSLGELALAMMHLIADRFSYRRGITTSASSISHLLEQGSGVCQDFTHLMIGMARQLRVPARYVSGIIHSDSDRYVGTTETHAWCELLFPSAGWIGFDPTNSCLVGGNFVKVAIGRDFRDVTPNKGQFTGNASETIEVAVRTELLSHIPPELAAERVQPLPIPIYNQGPAIHLDYINQQQEQQQQGR